MNFVSLDVAIGLILIYFLLSLAVLAINEGIATIVNFRAQTLRGGISALLTGTASAREDDQKARGERVTDAVYAHPLIDALYEVRVFGRGGRKQPSYIPPRTFVLALIDGIAESARAGIAKAKDEAPLLDPANDLFEMQRAIRLAELPDALRKQLEIIVRDAQGDLARAKLALERWFDDAMERVSATYKARIHAIGLVVAVVVTLVANADTIAIARALTVNPTLRAAMVAQAQEAVKNPPALPAADSAKPVPFDTLLRRSFAGLDTAKAFGLPLGYGKRPADKAWMSFYGGQIWAGLGGLLITSLAVSLGAPFWFDLLNKVVNIRGAGRSPEEKPKSPEARPAPRGA